MLGVKKQHLPEKICAACGRLFAWRKKWERDWANVKFCSDACRRGKGPRSKAGSRVRQASRTNVLSASCRQRRYRSATGLHRACGSGR
jgi:hypothetical protein